MAHPGNPHRPPRDRAAPGASGFPWGLPAAAPAAPPLRSDMVSVRSATLEPHETVRAAKRLDLMEAGSVRRYSSGSLTTAGSSSWSSSSSFSSSSSSSLGSRGGGELRTRVQLTNQVEMSSGMREVISAPVWMSGCSRTDSSARVYQRSTACRFGRSPVGSSFRSRRRPRSRRFRYTSGAEPNAALRVGPMVRQETSSVSLHQP